MSDNWGCTFIIDDTIEKDKKQKNTICFETTYFPPYWAIMELSKKLKDTEIILEYDQTFKKGHKPHIIRYLNGMRISDVKETMPMFSGDYWPGQEVFDDNIEKKVNSHYGVTKKQALDAFNKFYDMKMDYLEENECKLLDKVYAYLKKS